jgi:hypothetical protein
MRDVDGVVGADVMPRIVIRVAVVLGKDVGIDLADGVDAEGVETAVGAGVQRVAIDVVELQCEPAEAAGCGDLQSIVVRA